MSLSFHTFDPAARQLRAATGAIEAYPGGDVAVRHLEPSPAGQFPVAWNVGGTLDFAALAQWVAFHRDRRCSTTLVMPYLPSARGDHDVTCDAKTVARLAAATGIDDVIAADPHSSVWGDSAADWGTTVHAITAADLIRQSALTAEHWEWTAVIAPDKGAVERAAEASRALGVPLLTAGKVRDSATGKLSGFTAPDGIEPGRFLVVDDICDGGGTFAGLAQVVREAEPAAQLHLWVTHGLFTGRWRENLLPNFTSITAASAEPGVDTASTPSEVGWVPLQPYVVDALSQLIDHSQTR